MTLSSNLPSLGSTLRVFIDTEFTDFIDMRLISIGAACDNGSVFYGENKDVDLSKSSSWVKDIVHPLLTPNASALPYSELSAKLWEWMDELPCQFISIIVTYDGDYELLHELFGMEQHPKMLGWENIHKTMASHCSSQIIAESDFERTFKNIKANFELRFLNFFIRTRKVHHHALSDAEALREAYLCTFDNFCLSEKRL